MNITCRSAGMRSAHVCVCALKLVFSLSKSAPTKREVKLPEGCRKMSKRLLATHIVTKDDGVQEMQERLQASQQKSMEWEQRSKDLELQAIAREEEIEKLQNTIASLRSKQ